MADDKSSQKNEMSMGGGCIRQLGMGGVVGI